MQEQPNPFEHLKVSGISSIDAATHDIEHHLTITENRQETAIITTRKTGVYWYGGFQFYWRNGITSCKRPDPANGLFRTEQDTRLYYIAYLSLFMDYYIEETKIAIRAALNEYSQQILF